MSIRIAQAGDAEKLQTLLEDLGYPTHQSLLSGT